MIQCVGSRTPDNPNCSRVCCQSAIKNALRVLDLNPDMQVFVLYRDIRALRIYEGASDVQKVIIARQTLDAFAAGEGT